MSVLLGFDIGGSKFMVAATTAQGNILRRTRADTPHDLDDGLALLERMAREVAGDDTVAAGGAACGGPLDWRRGIVSPLHQPEWRNVDLAGWFRQHFGRPFRVEVDTDAAALAEHHFGAANLPTSHLLYLTISTGIGGGYIVNGEIFRGADGAHPEVGHTAAAFTLRGQPATDVPCACGATGCLEAVVSGSAIRKHYGMPAEQLGNEHWREVAGNLGKALRNLAATYAPEVIVLGGGVAVGGGEAFVSEAAAAMRAGLKLVPAPRVRLSTLGYDTALMGAIALAQEAAR